MAQQESKKLIFYGAGNIGKNVILSLALQFRAIPIECFCDRDEKKSGSLLLGIPVRTPLEVRRRYPKGTFFLFFTMTGENTERAKRELAESGIFDEDDFYDEQADPLNIVSALAFRRMSGLFPEAPLPLKSNHLSLDSEREARLKESLLTNYFHLNSEEELRTDYLKADFADHLFKRLESDRTSVIPWLNSIQPLENASVLEIGCGTGTSTVALCEQKAKVTAIDVSDDAMDAARDRLRLYGLEAEVLHMNAADILEDLPGRTFDFIIFFASLEHMTFDERIRSIRAAFQMLNPGGHLVLAMIPNRLWYIDSHTSREPFFHWLPDRLAMEYARFTEREDFNQGFDAEDPEDSLRFARWGRGVSYHEFEIALGGRDRFQVESSMNTFYHVPDPIFKDMLRLLGHGYIHEGFYDPNLTLSMKRAY